MALVCARASTAQGRKNPQPADHPDETGRGAPSSASGRHFLGSAPFGPSRPRARLDGWSEKAITLETLPIRDAAGAPLTGAQIDAEAEIFARDCVAQGARALLHVLDCSKTGLSGLSRETARKLLDEFPENISVVVDACQLRAPPATLRADLAAGFMVMVSGSKFAGGPAFSGALLLPPDMVFRLARQAEIAWPAGLAAHSAALDWSPALRAKLPGPFGARANPGLGLRWEAALAEYELYLSHDPATVATATLLFGERARSALAHSRSLRCDNSRGAERTIFSIFSRKLSGEPLPAAPILDALRAKGFHLGQPVRIGTDDALRLCLSAPQINDFALRRKSGADEATAFAPLAAEMAALFDKWQALIAAD